MNSQFTVREQIIEVINKFFVYTDNQEWTKLQEEIFAANVELDMVSMGADKAELVSSRELCDRWEKAFEELDAIHHQSGNYIVNIIGEMAKVNAYAVATHYKELAQKGQTRKFTGSYDIHLSKRHGDWRIDKLKYNLKYSSGNMSLE